MPEASDTNMSAASAPVPVGKRIMWGLGGFTDATITYGLFSMINAVYVNALGVNAVMVGLACAIPRLLDSFSDPLAGLLSDNTRSRWGRRKPWLLAGLVICAISGILMWYAPLAHDGPALRSGIPLVANGEPTSWWSTAVNAISAEWSTFVYVAGMTTLLMAVGYTLFNVPHYAMGYEMTTGYDERTHLFKWRFLFYGAAGFLTPWLIPLCMWFEGDSAQVLRGSQGVYPVAFILGAVILATGIPTLFCAEHTSMKHRQPALRFREAVRLTLYDRPFMLLVSSNFIARFGMAVTGIFFYYLFVYHIGKGDQVSGASLLAVFFNTINLANVIAMAPIAWLATRLGKKWTLILLLALSAVAYASLLVTLTNDQGSYISPTLALGDFTWSPLVHWPSIATAVLIGLFTNTIPMVTNSMIADVCDFEEWRTGMRREGFYGAAYTSIEKLAWSVSLLFQGILLAASGFNASLAQQAPEAIQFWILALIVTQPAGFLVAMVIILFYPLTRARVASLARDIRERTQGGATP
jgi:glycoside/pentoside/hexuronide:cation symporter, GPH family